MLSQLTNFVFCGSAPASAMSSRAFSFSHHVNVLTTDSEAPYHPSLPLIDVYPYGTSMAEILQNHNATEYESVKTTHWLRHAEGYHNVNKDYRSRVNIDAAITEMGIQQCRALASDIRNSAAASEDSFSSSSYKSRQQLLSQMYSNTTLVVTSPLTRCMETTLLALDPILQRRPEIPVIAHEKIRETVNYNCDRRRSTLEIAKLFPKIDVSWLFEPNDSIWNRYEKLLGDDLTHTKHRESANIGVVAERGMQFFTWLGQRKENHVIVCTHAAFLRCIWNFGCQGGIPYLPPQKALCGDDDGMQRTRNRPLIRYCGEAAFEASIRADFKNCELRSMILAFRKQ